MPETLSLKIANVTVPVPVYINEKTTREVAQQVTEKMKEIEGVFGRVDTQGFAIRAAYEFAMELHALQHQNEKDTQELNSALSALTTRLQELVNEFRPVDKSGKS